MSWLWWISQGTAVFCDEKFIIEMLTMEGYFASRTFEWEEIGGYPQ